MILLIVTASCRLLGPIFRKDKGQTTCYVEFNITGGLMVGRVELSRGIPVLMRLRHGRFFVGRGCGTAPPALSFIFCRLVDPDVVKSRWECTLQLLPGADYLMSLKLQRNMNCS
ncbi:MAG: hypothetical protein MUO63_10370 [Desulfobulbaceae bacterium]|nr:hypothetical protein [Desulfobulbaceae bacterium]